jgi:hypothetical protein
MESRQKITLIIGLIITAALFPFSPYISAVALVIVLALFISFLMLNTSKRFQAVPELTLKLQDDAKGVIVKNKGGDTALNIHIALVPLDIEFDIPKLEPDAIWVQPCSHMIETVKVVAGFENAQGRKFSHSVMLSALEEEKSEEDLLKPMFPMFGWKDDK